jgi:hypothetical protein
VRKSGAFFPEDQGSLKNPQRFPYHASVVLRLSGLVLLGLVLSVAPVACVYDGDNRCGPHQVLLSEDRCACDDDYIPGPGGCVPCGENERASNGSCVCVDGFARAADNAACAEIPAELGADCDTDSTPCPDGSKYPLCHVVNGTSGYCTSTCADSGDCDGGYKCHQNGSDSFCRRPPIDYGNSCQTADDCAGGEATFCETIQSHLCLVPCEAGKTDGCFEGDVCCDFAIFHPICVPSNACESMTGTVIQ